MHHGKSIVIDKGQRQSGAPPLRRSGSEKEKVDYLILDINSMNVSTANNELTSLFINTAFINIYRERTYIRGCPLRRS